MPEGLLDHAILSSFEAMAPFDEFQNFGLDPLEDRAFVDIENEDLGDLFED